MKTAIQDLIEAVDKSGNQPVPKSLLKETLTELLKKEKQCIIDAVEHGKEFGDIIKEDLGIKYFKSIFEND